MCAWIRILHLTNFAFKKSTFRPVQYLWESNEEQDETDLTWQQKGIENRLKRLRYTISEGRVAERSKAPDSWEIHNWTSGTNVCLGSNPSPVKICAVKANLLFEAAFVRTKGEAASQILQYKKFLSKTHRTIVIYDFWRQDGRAV